MKWPLLLVLSVMLIPFYVVHYPHTAVSWIAFKSLCCVTVGVCRSCTGRCSYLVINVGTLRSLVCVILAVNFCVRCWWVLAFHLLPMILSVHSDIC